MPKARLTVAQVLAWADAHCQGNGAWPTTRSGPVAEARGETWQAVDQALRLGLRGLPGGDSLPRLLWRERQAPMPTRWRLEEARRRRVAQLRARGLSAGQIAARLNLGPPTVSQLLQRVESEADASSHAGRGPKVSRPTLPQVGA
jgi:hypothetical protein